MTLKEAEKVVREVMAHVEQFRAELGRSERRRNCEQYLSGFVTTHGLSAIAVGTSPGTIG